MSSAEAQRTAVPDHALLTAIETPNYGAMFRSSPASYMLLDRDLRIADANDSYLRTTGRRLDEIVGCPVFEAFPAEGERRRLFDDALRRALAGEANELIETPYAIPDPSAADGFRTVYWDCWHIPVRDTVGSVTHVLQNAEDVTARVEAQRRAQVVARELDHRVRNILSVVVAVSKGTARSANTIDSFLTAFSARLDAMMRTYNFLAESDWDGMSLRGLLHEELSPFLPRPGISIDGPPIELAPRPAQTLSMTIHELATNAAKYGALSDEDGQLDIRWSVAPGPDPILMLEWRERLRTVLAGAGQSGFGSILIDRLTAADLNGTVRRELKPDGLQCRIEVPLGNLG